MPGWTKAAEENRKPKRRSRYATDPVYRQERIDDARRWAAANPERRFANLLRSRYGITVEQYNEMLSEQNSLCFICQKPETQVDHRSKKVLRLSVDHCHESGVIRGLLCRKCNYALGLYDGEPHVFEAMAAYLQRDFGLVRPRK